MKGTAAASILLAVAVVGKTVENNPFQSAEDTNVDSKNLFGSTGCTLTGGESVAVRYISHVLARRSSRTYNPALSFLNISRGPHPTRSYLNASLRT
jgi:hypothetical protein